MAWLYLLIAGLFEVAWAIGLKYTDGFTRLIPSIWTVVSMAVSFLFLSLALKTLPVGTAYAVWTGDRRGRGRDPWHCPVRGARERAAAWLHRHDRRRHRRP